MEIAPYKPDRFSSAVGHYVAARVRYGPDLLDWIARDAGIAGKTVLDIGCGWGSAIECISRYGIKEAHGITLSTEQVAYCRDRGIDNAKFWLQDYAKFEPPAKYDGLISIEMIDHLCSPAQAREGKAVKLYRDYFNKLAEWVEPGAAFGFQAILRNRVPRSRKDLEDLAFTADIIFPGGLNPRIEELVVAINPKWELEELIMRCLDREPDRRPQGVDLVLDELDALAESHPWTDDDARSWWERFESGATTHDELYRPPHSNVKVGG